MPNPVPLPIVGPYNKQRFVQFDPSDSANWFLQGSPTGKKKVAMYPVMGRRHIHYNGQNRLIFSRENRGMFKSVKYWYNFVGDTIYRIDSQFNQVEISQNKVVTSGGNVYFAFLVAGDITYACFTDGTFIYVYNESTNDFTIVTDTNAPMFPTYIAAFGNRIVVSTADSNQFSLSDINQPTIFTINMLAVAAQEEGIIRQMGVLNNTLYIFTDYTTGVWSNMPTTFTSFSGTEISFPWKKNTTYSFQYGIAASNTLSIGFGMMVWLARNSEGLIQTMASMGQMPEDISNEAVDVAIQRIVNINANVDFETLQTNGFIYCYENNIFYRLSIGSYVESELENQVHDSISFEYNFASKEWNRCIEINGDRCRIQKHVFFFNRHLVSVQKEGTIYEMSGRFYTNDVLNSNQTDPQAPNAYLSYPFRYERVTPLIFEDDYMDFITSYVEIDFVFGATPYVKIDAPYDNAQYIVGEQNDDDGQPIFMVSEQDSDKFIIAEQGDFPVLDSPTYYQYFKPSIELLYSDDGGISYESADVREFSQLGKYQWRMRWYQLGTSANRCYKLICTSPVPIVILGGVQLKWRAYDGSP